MRVTVCNCPCLTMRMRDVVLNVSGNWYAMYVLKNRYPLYSKKLHECSHACDPKKKAHITRFIFSLLLLSAI